MPVRSLDGCLLVAGSKPVEHLAHPRQPLRRALGDMLLATAFSGLPLVICGALKIAYDVALLKSREEV
jgi:hypothetical protein